MHTTWGVVRKTVITLAFSAPLMALSSQQEAVTKWLSAHAIRLQSVEPTSAAGQWAALDSLIGQPRVVALGESTHGTSEFFKVKDSIVRTVVQRHTPTVFAIEANMPEADLLDRYVEDGVGDPKHLLKGLGFWTWDTQEVLAMIKWMRSYNASGRGHVSFAGFDMQDPTLSLQIVRTFVAAHDPGYIPEITAAYAPYIKAAADSRPHFGVASKTIPASGLQGSRVVLSGFIRTSDVKNGYAGLWLNVAGKTPGSLLFLDNMRDRGVTGTTPWTRFEVVAVIPEQADQISFGALLQGQGTAWFDSLHITKTTDPASEAITPDLNFEDPDMKGLFRSGEAYQIGIDETQAQAGHSSLRMSYIGTHLPSVASMDQIMKPAKAASVVQHLEALKTQLESDGARPEDVEWAIENARLVRQYAEFKMGAMTRDKCMAENVEWIANQHPTSKLVLWAHNGHIAYGGYPEIDSMGRYLHEYFGSTLVSLGLFFNKGSFRAIQLGQPVGSFSVGDAPLGTWENMFASTGMPLFAIDFRILPSRGDASEWLRGCHPARSIGSEFNATAPGGYFEPLCLSRSYDGIVFIESAHAANPN